MQKRQKVFVIGNGMTKFLKPRDTNPDYPELGKLATQRALRDAGVPYSSIESAFVGYVYGDSTCGQRCLYEVGLTGIPVVNVNNNCATGSSALFLGFNHIAGGMGDCVLCLGFEKMSRGSLQTFFTDRTIPLDKVVLQVQELMPPQGFLFC